MDLSKEKRQELESLVESINEILNEAKYVVGNITAKELRISTSEKFDEFMEFSPKYAQMELDDMVIEFNKLKGSDEKEFKQSVIDLWARLSKWIKVQNQIYKKNAQNDLVKYSK